ncbi:MAG: serine/threonine-protein kinase, partial [Ilumatobacteraceae bacterium]
MEDDRADSAGAAIGGLDGRLIAGRYSVAEVVATTADTIITTALDGTSNQPVTVKIVRPELATTDVFRQAFRRHAEVATALTHPNIATVLDFGEVDLDSASSVYWVVEHLSGGSLRDLFDRGRLLAPSQALVVGLEACRALDVAHQRGIVHTELRPSKMLFGEDRRLRIVDFGMARLLGEHTWSDPAHVPTDVARYASPEQALGIEVDERTDVYALTLSLIEAVTGSVPFAADSTVATLTARVGKLMLVSADLGSLAAVLERGGRPEAADRSSAAELGQGLVQAASKLPRPE